MRVGRALGLRIVLVALASGMVGMGVTRAMSNRAVTEAIADGLRGQMQAGEQARCERAPSAWSLPIMPGWHAFAFDASSRSANPEAPSLDPALASQAARIGESGVEPVDLRRAERALVVRVADAGPCALVAVRWPARLLARRMVPKLGASVVVTAVLAAALGLLAVARPIGRRAARLRAQAERVGRGDPLVLDARGEGDELRVVEEELARADERIRRDADERAARSQALERHLEHVAHDLRTPLTSLQLSVEQALGATARDESRALLEEALHDCVYLGALLDDLRDAARLEGGWDPAATAVSYDLGAVVARVAGRLGVLARRRSIELDHALPDEPLTVVGDPLAGERVLANLVINAIDHGAAGGHVAVVLRAQAGERFELMILDDGPGLPATALSDLPAPRRAGRGQGLRIVQTLCERSGWSLAVEPQEPGSLVRIAGARSAG